MARPSLAGMTISKLESMLNQQRSKKKDLIRERDKLQSQLDKLNLQIAGLDGNGNGGGGGGGGNTTSSGRARNEKSLVTTLEEVLAKNPKGMTISDIVEAVLGSGYKSSSPNFRGIVNQTLIRERKKFDSVSRGVYAMMK